MVYGYRVRLLHDEGARIRAAQAPVDSGHAPPRSTVAHLVRQVGVSPHLLIAVRPDEEDDVPDDQIDDVHDVSVIRGLAVLGRSGVDRHGFLVVVVPSRL
jgi:hypothetical protein